jgi:Domain of unknown function (DUF4404)
LPLVGGTFIADENARKQYRRLETMSDENSTNPQAADQIRADLLDFARKLREGGRLNAEAQQVLAGLLEELGSELDPAALPTEQTIHLAELTSQLARSIQEHHVADVELRDAGLIASARERLDEAARWAETHAPVATGIVRRFIDVLSGIGV